MLYTKVDIHSSMLLVLVGMREFSKTVVHGVARIIAWIILLSAIDFFLKVKLRVNMFISCKSF